MEDDTWLEQFKPANDSIGSHGEPDTGKPSSEKPSMEGWRKIDRVAVTLARIIGRRMAREDFERLHAANDNSPIVPETTEDGVDTE